MGTQVIAERMKSIGDDHFAAGCYLQARHAYTAGLQRADRRNPREHVIACHVNRAAAYLKLGAHQDAIEDATAALELAEHNGAPPSQKRKALLRRAQAFCDAGKLEAARLDLETLPAGDAVAQKLLERVRGTESGITV